MFFFKINVERLFKIHIVKCTSKTWLLTQIWKSHPSNISFFYAITHINYTTQATCSTHTGYFLPGNAWIWKFTSKYKCLSCHFKNGIDSTCAYVVPKEMNLCTIWQVFELISSRSFTIRCCRTYSYW